MIVEVAIYIGPPRREVATLRAAVVRALGHLHHLPQDCKAAAGVQAATKVLEQVLQPVAVPVPVRRKG